MGGYSHYRKGSVFAPNMPVYILAPDVRGARQHFCSLDDGGKRREARFGSLREKHGVGFSRVAGIDREEEASCSPL